MKKVYSSDQMSRQFETKYGYFTADGKEFIIKDYKTPKPWVNVISNGNYGLIVSQVNGGFSWITHSNLNRLTRWNQDLVQDNWGKYIYLRDEKTGRYWSPTVHPVYNQVKSYSCRHGVGYTIFHSELYEISAELRIFVPFGEDLEIWTLTLKNTGNEAREIGIYTYLEWCLGVAPDNHREFHKTFLESQFSQSQQIFFAKKRLWEIPSEKGHWNVDWPATAYFAASTEVDAFEGDKEKFIGRARGLSNPIAVEKGVLRGTQGKWNDDICSLRKQFNLSPHKQERIDFFLGAEKDEKTISKIIKKYRGQGEVNNAFQNTKMEWDRIISTSSVKTPDPALDILTNTWLKYQAISGRLWARAGYYQQSGAFGFRDQLQDSLIFLYNNPENTKKQIILHAKHQFKDGRALHWWHPITETGLDAEMSDDLLWLPFVTIQYLKESSEWEILEENKTYFNTQKAETLLGHCLKAIDMVLNRMSKRGLPLILAGDWNDGLSAVGLKKRGESIWLGHFLYYILQEFRIILQKVDQLKKMNEYRDKAIALKNAINEYGWDGNWFWRASKDKGEKIGSHLNEEGKIFLNAQTWSVIADSTDERRKKIAMSAVRKYLDSDVGPLLLYPAYKNPDADIGYLTRYAPGVRENGGVYMHAAAWTIWAAALLGDADFAYRIFRKICPIYNGMNPDKYVVEPFVTPGNVDGIDSPYYGQGGWTWYTGSAAWLLRMIFDQIIGVQADYDGLRIKPCFPSHWDEINLTRYFRTTNYEIKIINQAKQKTEKLEICVDGQKIAGNLIPHLKNQERATITVTLS